jgi:hypothetical protein
VELNFSTSELEKTSMGFFYILNERCNRRARVLRKPLRLCAYRHPCLRRVTFNAVITSAARG